MAKLNLRMVECFKAVMAVGTVTGAAEILSTSQPAVSRSIKLLEEVVGSQLFDRRKRRLHPTAQAYALHAEVEKVFRGLDHLQRAATNLRSFRNGHITIVCAPAFSQGFIAEVASNFTRKHRDVSLTIDTQMSWMIGDLLNEQKCDIGLAAYDMSVVGAACTPLDPPREVCVMAADHRLAGRAVIDAKDLDGESCIFMIERDPYRARLDRVFSRADVQRRLVIEVANSAAACALALKRCGVAIINPFTALDHVGQGLVLRPFSAGEPFFSTLLRAKHRPSSLLVDELAAEVVKVWSAYSDQVENHLKS